MSDLLKRLRKCEETKLVSYIDHKDCGEAADEIERQAKIIDRISKILGIGIGVVEENSTRKILDVLIPDAVEEK